MNNDVGRRSLSIELSFICNSLIGGTFLLGVVICARLAIALLWENDFPNLEFCSSTLCLIGITTWMIFVIVGWVRHYSTGVFRWRLILATVLTIMDSVSFWSGYDLISLVFAALIFSLLSLYFFTSREERKLADWVSRKAYPD